MRSLSTLQPASTRSLVPFLAFGCLMFAACAAGDARFTVQTPAGFWYGLWHGAIAPISFVVGLFADGVEIYERANRGGWYDFGFLLGILCISGGGHHSQRRWRDGRDGRALRGVLPPGHGSARVKVDIDWTGDEPRDKPTDVAP